MRKRSNHRKLSIESLEDRRFTATLSGAIEALPIAPKGEIAMVQSIGPLQQVTLVRSIVDTGSWKAGIRLNHNETLLRARRRGRKLQIESLEDRRLTAAISGHPTAFTRGPQSEVALVRSISPVEQVNLIRGIVDTSSWKAGLTRNHNETLVRAKRRSKRKGQAS